MVQATQAIGESENKRDAFAIEVEQDPIAIWTAVLIAVLVLVGVGVVAETPLASLIAFVGIGIAIIGTYIWARNRVLEGNIAVDQFLQLADEIGLKLTTEEIVALSRSNKDYAYTLFVSYLPERFADAKDNYFISSGGTTAEACQRFVKFLHEHPEQYRTSEIKATDQNQTERTDDQPAT